MSDYLVERWASVWENASPKSSVATIVGLGREAGQEPECLAGLMRHTLAVVEECRGKR